MTLPSIAVGLVCFPSTAHTSHRRRTRIALALHAARHGHVLVDTLDIDSDTPQESTLRELEELTRALDAQAVVVAGPVDRQRISTIAEQVRLVVLELPEPGDSAWPPSSVHL